MTISAAQPRELIPGYLATERLGAGGYGEVWKVEAPGGLVKAVKLIYGFLGDERAERELKALHRVKQVRHPFVLSLERIEVIDNRLLIVTELADMSLMDRFEQCRAGKLPGIPRGELLVYVQDAADALDYMQQTHALQHLDIKPENLLTVGGRAKVADFGLVKELTDRTRSLVGAMTPSYAAPELFDGRASEYCDQYSLAIVYQEMLTGVLPFPGRTAAQLAAQHTQMPPQLGALPAAERPIIERALSKRPEDRYPTCREFVQALAVAGSEPASAPPGRTTEGTPHKRDTGTLCMDDTHRTQARDAPADAPAEADALQRTEMISARLSSRSIHVAPKPTMERPRLKVGREVVDAPPPAIEKRESLRRNDGHNDAAGGLAAKSKSFVIGLGGTGIDVLGRLNRCLQARAASPEQHADVQMLAFDTDRQTIRQAGKLGMDPADAVLLRLRQAHEYRADSDALLKWIGRRWLYNVPKSAQTGGIRPLGRLALVDHAGIVASKLRRRLAALCQQDEQANGEDIDVRPGLRIVLIGACSGGTGGGMLLEMAYAVQNLAAQAGCEDVTVTAVVTHATNRCKTEKQLAQANAYSFLSEVQHCRRYGSVSPETCAPQAALYEGDQWPIRDFYFCHLGDDLDAEQFQQQLQRVADYLHADLATPMHAALEACRREPGAAECADGDLYLRSFRANTFEGLGQAVGQGIAQLLIDRVGQIWFAPAPETAPEEGAAEQTPAQGGPPPQNTASTAQDPLLRCLEPLGAVQVARRLRRELIHRLARAQEQNRSGDPRGREETARRLSALCDDLARVKKQSDLESPPLAELAEAVALSETELRTRVAKQAEVVAEDLLNRGVESCWLPPAANGAEAALPDALAQQAQSFTAGLLQACLPGARLSGEGEMRPDVNAMLDALAEPAANAYPFGCRRRTLVLRPENFGIDADFSRGLNRPCGFIDGAPISVTVCQELDQISLAQMAHLTVGDQSEIRRVAARIHTRADIQWTEPPLVECES